MKTNEELQIEVQAALKWEPMLHSSEIGVIADDGVITLTGSVDTYAKKTEAENAVKNVAGVKAVVERIQLTFGSFGKKDDSDIASEIISAFKWNWEIPDATIHVKVEDCWVTLDGEVEWNYQKEAAKKAVTGLLGVVGVTDSIIINSYIKDSIEQRDIQKAIERNSFIEDDDVKVKVSGNTVTLSGSVHSLFQKDECGRMAWNAPGVFSVKNDLEIDYAY
ncbi:BON domain-containing protein [Dyadobacter sp. 3J3]|uniref:BON domain-containing protein n=1 Tax=Dyadobacter sp. 3J3 TaxID=2606600 RepID=UPI0013582D82|nr:BON domain-containing protein [Dyadobacter sp. 3J3]